MTDDQRTQALATANERRIALADLRRDLRAGRTTIEDVLRNPPACVTGLPVYDVIRLRYAPGANHRTRAWGAKLGAEAVRANVNLLIPIGRASQQTREWAAEHVAKRRTIPARHGDSFSDAHSDRAARVKVSA